MHSLMQVLDSIVVTGLLLDESLNIHIPTSTMYILFLAHDERVIQKRDLGAAVPGLIIFLVLVALVIAFAFRRKFKRVPKAPAQPLDPNVRFGPIPMDVRNARLPLDAPNPVYGNAHFGPSNNQPLWNIPATEMTDIVWNSERIPEPTESPKPQPEVEQQVPLPDRANTPPPSYAEDQPPPYPKPAHISLRRVR